jgi:hypothetical protein
VKLSVSSEPELEAEKAKEQSGKEEEKEGEKTEEEEEEEKDRIVEEVEEREDKMEMEELAERTAGGEEVRELSPPPSVAFFFVHSHIHISSHILTLYTVFFVYNNLTDCSRIRSPAQRNRRRRSPAVRSLRSSSTGSSSSVRTHFHTLSCAFVFEWVCVCV